MSEMVATLGGSVRSDCDLGGKARNDHDLDEIWKVIESWQGITSRHERRRRHPHHCHNPTNRQWCTAPNCRCTRPHRLWSC